MIENKINKIFIQLECHMQSNKKLNKKISFLNKKYVNKPGINVTKEL